MSYLLRNDNTYTVRVSYEHRFGTYLCEVYAGLTQVVHHEFELAADCLDMARRFVDHHISSQVLWSLVNDSTAPPLVRPKSEDYTRSCRVKVEALYGRRAA